MANANEVLIEALRSTRPGFVEEGRLHKLLVDSYTGGGGFSNGRVPTPPVPFWGLSAYQDAQHWEAWLSGSGRPSRSDKKAKEAPEDSPSYLIAYYGENALEYRDRVDNSVYTNVVEPIVNVTHAFLMETDASRKNLGPLRTKWLNHVTLSGDSMREFMDSVLLRAQLTGWCLILADTPEDVSANLAESMNKGAVPFLSAYWPQQVLDYDTDRSGKITGLKLSTWHELERKSMLEPKRLAERITIWTATTWERWEIVDDDEDKDPSREPPPVVGGRRVQVLMPRTDGKRKINEHKGPVPHKFGRVPGVVCRWAKPPNDDPVKGHPQIATIAQIARKLYNLESERDDQLRKQTFGVLVVPTATKEGNDEQNGQLDIGTGNYFEEPWGALGLTRYIAPPGTPLEAYDRTIERKTLDAYRTAAIDPGLSRQAETAEARKIRFRQTNALLAAVAARLDRAEVEVLRLVGGVFGEVSDPDADKVEVKRKDDYAIVHVVGEIVDSVNKALEFPLHPKTKAAVVNAGIRSLLTDLSDEAMAELEALNEKFIVDEANKPPPAPPVLPPPPGAKTGDPSTNTPPDKPAPPADVPAARPPQTDAAPAEAAAAA